MPTGSLIQEKNDPKEWVSLICAVLLATVVGALPWMLGGVLASSYLILAIAGLFVLSTQVICTYFLGIPLRFPRLGFILLLAIVWSGVQLLPLPAQILDQISPSRSVLADFRDADQGETLVNRISVASERTRSDSAKLWVVAIVVCSAMLIPAKHRFSVVCLLAANGLILSIFGIIQRLTWNNRLFWVFESPNISTHSFASFVNHNNAGGYLCLTLACLLAVGVSLNLERWQRLAYIKSQRWSAWLHLDWQDCLFALAILLIGVAILFTVSRGAALGLVGAILSVGIVARLRRVRISDAILILVVAATGFVAWCGRSEFVWGRLRTIWAFEESKSSQHRFQQLLCDLQLLRENWLVGTGIGTYRFANLPSTTFEGYTGERNWHLYCEDQYLETAIVAGVPGCLILLTLICTVGWGIFRLLKSQSKQTLVIAILGAGALGSQLVTATFDFGLYQSSLAGLFAIICGFVCSAAEEEAEQSKKSARWFDYVCWATLLLCSVCAIPDLYGRMLIENEVLAIARIPRTVDGYRSRTEIDAQIERLELGLSWVPDDTLGNFCLSELYLERNQSEVFQSLKSDVSGEFGEQLWAGASIEHLHARAHALASTVGNVEMLRTNPIIAGNIPKSWQALKASEKACPLLAKTHHRIALTRALATGDTQPNLQSISNIVRLAPLSSQMRFKAASIALAEQQRDLGLKLFAESLRMQPRIPSTLVEFANLVLTSDEFVEVIEASGVDKSSIALSKAIKLAKPEHQAAIIQSTIASIKADTQLDSGAKAYQMYKILVRHGDRNSAITELVNAVTDSPSQIAWRFTLAKELASQGNYESALNHIDTCLAQSPNEAKLTTFKEQLLRKSKRNPAAPKPSAN